jgi:hypothetical protein
LAEDAVGEIVKLATDLGGGGSSWDHPAEVRNLDQVCMRSMSAVILTARRSAQNASRCAGALSDTLQVGMQTTVSL